MLAATALFFEQLLRAAQAQALLFTKALCRQLLNGFGTRLFAQSLVVEECLFVLEILLQAALPFLALLIECF